MADLKNEFLDISKSSQKQASVASKEVLKLYKSNLDSVRQQIASLYMKYTVEGELKISQTQRLQELNSLYSQLSEQLTELCEKEIEITSKTTAKAAEDTYYGALYTIDKGIKSGVKISPLRAEFAEYLANNTIEGKTFSDRIWENTNALATRVKVDVEKAMIQGASPEKLARKIKNDFGSTAYQAQRVINTEVARAVTLAQDECYQNSGVVQYVMFDATLEDNTCDICAGYDGRTYPLDNHPDVPQHPNCRCAIIPVVEGWKPTQKRENAKDSETGEKTIIDYSDVNTWRKSRGL